MINLADTGNTLGDEACDHHGCAGAKITAPYFCSCKDRLSFHNGGFSIHLDLCSHFQELRHIIIPIVPDILRYDAGAFRNSQTGEDLRLHICGEAGIRHGFDIGAVQLSV